jgi:hypothetical protein
MSPQHAAVLELVTDGQHHEFAHLRKKFHGSTPDPEWISALGAEKDWIILSGDTRITTHPANKKAWHESRLTAFFFSEPFPNDNCYKQAETIFHWWPEIIRQAKMTPTGHGFLIPKSGNELRPLYPEPARRRR